MKAMQVSKQCSRCKRIKLLKEFYTDPSTSDNLHGWCKNCCREDKNIKNESSRLENQEIYELGESEEEREKSAREALTELTE